MLASGTVLRKQTPEERIENPTTFGYARFPLSDAEREQIVRELEWFAQIDEWAATRWNDPIPPHPIYGSRVMRDATG